MPTKKLARKVVAQPRPEAEDDNYMAEEEDDAPVVKPVKAVAPVATANGNQADDDDDDDAAPMFKIRGGRTEATRQAEATSAYAKSYRASTGSTDIIKFLEDVPYACYRRHWVPMTTAEGKPTQRPVVCHATGGRPCPICEVGDRGTGVYSYNIAIVGDDGQVLHRSWDMGIRVYKQAESYSTDPKFAPLTRNFYTVKKSGEGTSTSYALNPVRASALVEDFDMVVPDDSEFAALDRYDASIIEIETPKRMREIARELSAEY